MLWIECARHSELYSRLNANAHTHTKTTVELRFPESHCWIPGSSLPGSNISMWGGNLQILMCQSTNPISAPDVPASRNTFKIVHLPVSNVRRHDCDNHGLLVNDWRDCLWFDWSLRDSVGWYYVVWLTIWPVDNWCMWVEIAENETFVWIELNLRDWHSEQCSRIYDLIRRLARLDQGQRARDIGKKEDV